MNGFFNIKLLDSGNFTDNDFIDAINTGCINNLINNLDTDGVFCGKNRIFDNMAGYLLDYLFSLPDCDSPYKTKTGDPASLAFVCMLNTDNEPFYTENWTGAANPSRHNVQDSVNSASAAKLFIIDEIIKYDLWVGENRDEIVFKSSFLYLPTQCVADDIKSIGIFWAKDVYLEGNEWNNVARIGRVRLKDGSGVPITIDKTINHVMFVEYLFSVVSI